MKHIVSEFIFQLGHFGKRYLAKCTCLLSGNRVYSIVDEESVNGEWVYSVNGDNAAFADKSF